jgi:hypothetical protein
LSPKCFTPTVGSIFINYQLSTVNYGLGVIKLDFVDRATGRHLLDCAYERFAKPQLHDTFKPSNPSIYIRHQEGELLHGYVVEKVFEDTRTGFYAEGRYCLGYVSDTPILVIRGYGSWYPFDRVLEDTPDVFIARLQRQLKAAEKSGAVDWLTSTPP